MTIVEEHEELAPQYVIRLCQLLEALVGRVTFGERLSTLVAGGCENVTLAAGQTKLYEYRGGFASVAVVNPNNFPVYIGLSRNDAVSGSELVSIPGASWIVLPLKAAALGVGAGANGGPIHVLPFETAQPFAAGSLGAAWAD